MDKRVVFAVAGSGKTTRLINELDLVKRVLLITYTESNCEEIRRRVDGRRRKSRPKAEAEPEPVAADRDPECDEVDLEREEDLDEDGLLP